MAGNQHGSRSHYSDDGRKGIGCPHFWLAIGTKGVEQHHIGLLGQLGGCIKVVAAMLQQGEVRSNHHPQPPRCIVDKFECAAAVVLRAGGKVERDCDAVGQRRGLVSMIFHIALGCESHIPGIHSCTKAYFHYGKPFG